MKIFLSYARADGGDCADQIYLSSLAKSNDIFRDLSSIDAGDVWSKTIENNISICDIMVVILTPEALESYEVEKEVLLAKSNNKKIMPCFFRYVDKDQIKWELKTFEGIEFGNASELVRNLKLKLDPKKKPPEELSYNSVSDGLQIETPENEMSSVSSSKSLVDTNQLEYGSTNITDQASTNEPEIGRVEEIRTKDVLQTKQRPKVRKTPTQTKHIKPNNLPKKLDKKDPRYLRLSALSPLNKDVKSHWYQKLVTLNREDKTASYETNYCPKCKKETRIYTNKAMKDAAWPDVVGECSICGTLLKLAIKKSTVQSLRPLFKPLYEPMTTTDWWKLTEEQKRRAQQRWWYDNFGTGKK